MLLSLLMTNLYLNLLTYKKISVHLDISKLPLRFMSKTTVHKNIRYFAKKKLSNFWK